MIKHFKGSKRSKSYKALKEASTYDYDKEGRAKIEVGLREPEDFFSPYSYLTYELMNPRVDEYIEMCSSGLQKNEEVSIDIYTEVPTDNDEKKRIRDTVRRHYAEQAVVAEKELKHNLLVGLFWCVMGFLVLFVEALLYNIVADMYLDTILAVIGWLFLWDGLEIIFYDRRELKLKRIRCQKLMDAKVHVRQYSKKIQREYGIGEFEEEEEE